MDDGGGWEGTEEEGEAKIMFHEKDLELKVRGRGGKRGK